MSGVYQTWSKNGVKLDIPQQSDQIKLLVNQLQIGYETYEKMVMIGDMNLCANKWEENCYLHADAARG